MSDYSYTDITIGGKLKESLVPDLLDQLHRLRTDEYTGAEKDLEDYMDDKGHIYAYSPEASWGELPDIQKFCESWGLSYTQHTESGLGITETETWYSPDLEYAQIVSLNNGSVYADDEQLQAIDDLLFNGLVDQARKVIADILVRAPAVPEFEIVKD